ncbi:MAG TPA: circadian clock KaiB family protein [Trichocoleus sp.]
MAATPHNPINPQEFKGIALFTPGGDLVYCLDSQKQARWHVDLCATLQTHLALPDPPYFLLPAYTATLDRWIDPTTGELVTLAEAYPRVLRFRALLNVVFGVEAVQWQPVYASPGTYSPTLIETYRTQFPQLWENHDLILRTERFEPDTVAAMPLAPQSSLSGDSLAFRLFVNGADAANIEELLRVLHTTFESQLKQPYTLKVIDVTKHPEQAEADQIAVTPTLIRAWPEPIRRIAGDLSSLQRLSVFLQSA